MGSMRDNFKCKGCGGSDVEFVEDEVDIGVGVQTHILGYICGNCGPHTVCDTCGTWDVEPCASWCTQVKEADESL